MRVVSMMISFGGFRFDPKQQVLYQHGDPVALTQKQAKLLALFLNEPDTVFSKEDILDQVWDGRAVSEQVVFQNISKLRTIIASSAIKTFPKRGYQWQMPLEAVAVEAAPEAAAQAKEQSAAWYLLPVLVLLIIAVLLVFLPRREDAARPEAVQTSNIVFVPIGARFEGSLGEERQTANQHFATTFLATPADDAAVSARAFMNSSFMERQRLGLTANELVMSGMLRRIQGRYFLVYRLQGQYRSWQAYGVADDMETLVQHVSNEAKFIARSKYFSLQDDAMVTAELTLLHNEAPESAAILTYLIERHLAEENYDVAGAYIDKLIDVSRAAKLPAYLSTALWFKGQKAVALQDKENAAGYLEEAAGLAEDAELLFIQSEVIKSMANISLQERDYEGIKRHLLHAASLSRLADEPVKEVRAYTLLSIMASKLGYADDKYDYLYHAKSLLADDQFDPSHYMLVHYHLGLFAKTAEDREKWYQETLKRPITPENEWVFESAADNLVDLLIDGKRWSEALAVAERVPAPATAHKLRAAVYIAQGDIERGVAEAKAAFTLARVTGTKWVTMPAALILLENSTANSDPIRTSEYRQYLKANLKGRWLNWQHDKLIDLGVKD